MDIKGLVVVISRNILIQCILKFTIFNARILC